MPLILLQGMEYSEDKKREREEDQYSCNHEQESLCNQLRSLDEFVSLNKTISEEDIEELIYFGKSSRINEKHREYIK